MATTLDIGPGAGVQDAPGLQIINGGKQADESSPGNIEHRGGDTTGGRLSAKQEGFVKSILLGRDNVTAYEENYETKGMTRKTMYEAASRLFANSKVNAKIMELKRRADTATVHSAASLRLHLETTLYGLTLKEGDPATVLKACHQLAQSEKVGFYLDRSVNLPAETLTEEEVLEQIEKKMKELFAEPA
jgi:hypothetical protein